MTADSAALAAPAAAVHGVLLLDKDRGLSSNAALQKAKRLLGTRKAGHTGSLDPLASGLLPICLGEATKLAGFLLDTDKRYRVTVRLGITTDSGDAEGAVTARRTVPALDAESIEAVLQHFRGTIVQVPPMYSALKHQGRRLYELARRGIQVERPGREVKIHELRLLEFDSGRLDLEVHCSKGTYIRSLAEDLGRALGCGAHVETLRRTAVGLLSVSRAHTLGQLQDLDAESRAARLEPMDLLVPTLPVVELGEAHCASLRHGQLVFSPLPELARGLVRLQDHSGCFIGIGELRDAGRIAPRRLFNLP